MPPIELSCVSWNIHGSVGRDGVPRPVQTAGVLQAIGADLCALQEVDARQRAADGRTALDELAEALGMHAVAGPARHEGGGFFGNALLTRFPVKAVERLDISVPGREPRAVLDVVVDVGDLELQVLVTHFGLRAAERVRQVKALLSLVARRPDSPAVIAGDFNEWRPRAGTIALLDRTLGRSPAVRSFPASLPLLRLDRIWARPRAALRSVQAHRGRDARIASDHLPVVAQLSFG